MTARGRRTRVHAGRTGENHRSPRGVQERRMGSAARFEMPVVWLLCAGAGLLGELAGCYTPRALPEGSPCERTEQCPSPQLCVLGSCSLGEPPADAPAPPSDARTDAPSDAAVDAMPLPCSTAGLSCSGTATMFTCGGHCWVRCSAAVARETGRAACAGWMGALGEIDDADEQTCVASHLGALTWIGLIQSDPANTPSTGWTWNGTTTPVTYTHWAAGQPDDGTSSTAGPETGREQCGLLRTDGTWADDPCSNPRSFFCERP